MSKAPVSGRNTSDTSKDGERRKRYQTLVDEFYQDVYRYGYWLTRNQSIAEDLVQETFLRAWRSFDSLQNDKAAKAWLFTILRRENARLYERYRPDLVDIDDVSLAEERAQEPDQRHRQTELHQAIMKLDRDYRDPLMLQVIGGFSGKEIAKILDLNNNTVMTRLFRARSKLKDMLAPEGVSGSSDGDSENDHERDDNNASGENDDLTEEISD